MLKVDFRHLANSYIRELTPYQPGKPIEELERELGVTQSIKLASNENPLGPSPHAIAAGQAAMNQAHFYPDGASFELKQRLSQFLSVKPEQLTIGNGSENILELIVKAYLHTNTNAVVSQYVFLTILLLIRSFGAQSYIVPALKWGHDIDSMIRAVDDETRVLFLVNPNNPTGTYNHEKDFHQLMKSIPSKVLVVVDEAYSEYIDREDYPNTLNYLSQYPNLIVTRTFSKIYGLAALRIGYAVSSPEIADILNRARLPFNVNSIAAKAACAALDDQTHVKNSIAMNNEGMKQLQQGFKKMQLDFIPSIANFITVNVKDARHVYQQLLHHGVIVRPLHAYDMPQYVRVTVGTEAQNERLLTTFKRLL